jgi:predicted KAP-like P-loop ATPase
MCYSGDPVVTFLAALMETLEPTEKSQWTRAVAKGTGVALGTAKIIASIAARKAGEEAVDGIENWLKGDGDESNLDTIISDFSKEASKTLTAQLTAQIAAERVRTQEMPDQMRALREALTKGKDTERVVILIDELDRCHPEYAISLLEAMKLVFDQDGFVLVLMVNADHLERLAGRLFGAVTEDERYLDKFVDIRLQLPKTD